MIYGYARGATDGQTVGAQVAALTAAGAAKVFRETASGAKTDRTQLRKGLAALEAAGRAQIFREKVTGARTKGATLKELANSYNVGRATISRLEAM